ncbi:hypothetical protein KC19_9G011000 [Ceratodon purpureus]|uniref:Uncharacterized protein n=1 Tax=Ceratodon purpureus TaxID=3225 RepID=A0A8T0GP19_CERPU|nr:hypothetical protein KC19_9G011000 [Ceratodon purpureus]
MAMLEATEDGSDTRPTPSRTEESPAAASKQSVDDRLVYKLVKVGDDGSVLPATEDEVFQSLVSGSGNGLSSFDPDGSDGGEDDEEDEEDEEEGEDDDEGTEYDTDDEDQDERDRHIPLQDLAAQRQKLRARLQVLDSMLLKVDAEAQQRQAAERDAAGNDLGHEDNYLSAGDGSGDKRHRRPNPKYFDFEGGEDAASGQPALSSSSGEPMLTPTKETAVSPRVTSGWGSHRSSVRSASTHRARSAVTQKPFMRTGAKVVSPGSMAPGMSSPVPHDDVSLDNLSIRELHEAFKSTYGRETSVKDKHWLKRQISAGWMRQRDAAFKSQLQLPSKLKTRLDQGSHAEQPLPSVSPTSVGAIERDAANEANGAEFHKDSAWNGLEGKGSQHGMTTPASVSTGGRFDVFNTGSLSSSGAARGQIALYGEVVNTGEPVGGKRQRKPNRKYIEEEAEAASGGTPVNDNRSPYGEPEGNGLDSSSNYFWRTVETDGPADMTFGRHGTLRGSTLRNASSKNMSVAHKPKLVSGIAKRKTEGRAAKLVKMAHSSRSTRQDSEGAVRKDELSGGPGDRASVLLPVVPFDPSSVLQPLPLDSRPENEQPIATVPTANGGTRRKHHRPWTLREVMTLVEGVARCGGGKWADIKKLAFSNVGYRTAVDLKDKWRNLLRASRAQLHPAKQGERKKQFTAAIPAPILARVRELAALQNQISPTAVSGSSTSRSGRTVHRK